MLPAFPFLLLDNARRGGTARLYSDPVRIVTADSPEQLRPALERLRAALAEGFDAAGFLAYEAGAVQEPRAGACSDIRPLLWFGLFRGWRAIADVPALLPDPAGAWAGAPRPRIVRAEYLSRFAQLIEKIRAGDLYQANLSFRADVPFQGHPAALYALLRRQAQAGHGALVAMDRQHWLLSLSPESFFTLEAGRLTARPMKGTAVRGDTPAADTALADALAADPKQRAENLMIVDLMRNDLSRIARPGSVQAPELFTVEHYPTVHQMVSVVTADLAAGLDAIDALAVLFPCGSVTGAPKIRAMQEIAAVEAEPRASYTGAIGRIDAGGDADFNVAIRTLSIGPGSGGAFCSLQATLGLGSGVVADSVGGEEWEECLAKGRFLTAGQPRFDLIETMRFEPIEGIALLERHLARLQASAAVFGFLFNLHAARNTLQAATFRLREAKRIRLLLAPGGALAVGVAPLPSPPVAPVTVALAPLPVTPEDFRLRHKTTRRWCGAAVRQAAGTFETLFTDPQGFLTEGGFTSLFVRRDGRLLTPPLTRGLLPGVLRAELLAQGKAEEADLRPDDLTGGFFLGNAVRGLISAVVQEASKPL